MLDLRFRRFDRQGSRAQREMIESIYSDAYADAIASGDPFESPKAFMQRLDNHFSNPAIDLVIAYMADEAVGQAWGWPLTSAVAWKGLVPAPEPGFTDEDGKRTFAFAEIMVRRAWTGREVAHALHDQLLSARTEKRAELFVLPENTRAYRAYLKWGWRKVGQIRPDLPDAPVFDVLVLPLPLGRT